ncbi:hypothetical protein GCM10027176_41130 [Actinoallomurus bryophytorum]
MEGDVVVNVVVRPHVHSPWAGTSCDPQVSVRTLGRMTFYTSLPDATTSPLEPERSRSRRVDLFDIQ